MGRKSVKINSESGKRLWKWLHEVDMTQGELADRIGYTQQYLSSVMTGKKALTPELAQTISDHAPKHVRTVGEDGNGVPFWEGEEKVRPEWLLCKDDNMTLTDQIIDHADKKELLHNSQWHILDQSLRKQGKKLILKHTSPDTPTGAAAIRLSKNDQCWYEIQTEDGRTLKKLTVIEFIKLQQKLQEYSDFLIYDLMK